MFRTCIPQHQDRVSHRAHRLAPSKEARSVALSLPIKLLRKSSSSTLVPPPFTSFRLFPGIIACFVHQEIIQHTRSGTTASAVYVSVCHSTLDECKCCAAMRKPFKYVSQNSTIVRTTSSRLLHVFHMYCVQTLKICDAPPE